MEAIAIGIVALIGGFVFGLRWGAKGLAPAIRETSNTQAMDRANFLQTLRRELANILVWRNPQRYLHLYRQIHSEVSTLGSWRIEEVHARLGLLTEKYPFYSDFDAIATREYVLYADGFCGMSDDELEGHYCDLVMFAALSSIADEAWKNAARKRLIRTTSDEELAHLTEYVQKIEDTKLHLRIDRAMHDNALGRTDDGQNLDNDFYKIIRLPHFAEIRYGVHLKQTNEFGIYSFFVYDDDQISRSFYRTDPTFETEQLLDPLYSVLEEVRFMR